MSQDDTGFIIPTFVLSCHCAFKRLADTITVVAATDYATIDGQRGLRHGGHKSQLISLHWLASHPHRLVFSGRMERRLPSSPVSSLCSRLCVSLPPCLTWRPACKRTSCVWAPVWNHRTPVRLWPRPLVPAPPPLPCPAAGALARRGLAPTCWTSRTTCSALRGRRACIDRLQVTRLDTRGSCDCGADE